MFFLDFFDIEERNGDSGGSAAKPPAEAKKPAESKPTVTTTRDVNSQLTVSFFCVTGFEKLSIKNK
jgi:hypothetical protein